VREGVFSLVVKDYWARDSQNAVEFCLLSHLKAGQIYETKDLSTLPHTPLLRTGCKLSCTIFLSSKKASEEDFILSHSFPPLEA
jgi:hypothetical protein